MLKQMPYKLEPAGHILKQMSHKFKHAGYLLKLICTT
jgi:hypothetical protein